MPTFGNPVFVPGRGLVGMDPDAPYVEKSSKPLNPPGWDTFHHVGCYKWSEDMVSEHSGTDSVVELLSSDSSPDQCAQLCAEERGGGFGFFGVTANRG